jgi:hypothetical protein
MITSRTSTRAGRLGPALLATLTALAVAACGDDDGGSSQPDATPGSADAAVDGGAPATPVYALTTQVIAAEGGNNISYVVVTDSLDGTALVLDEAVEVAGRALGVGPTGGGAVFVAGDAGPTVTRYDLQADGTLDEGPTVSFLGKGVSAITEYGGQFQFVSDSKAYYFDGATAQMIIWNPREMTVTGSVALTDLVITGATLTFTAAPLQVGGDVVTFAGWRKGAAEVPSQAGVVVVDGATDEVTVVTDTRCGYVRDGALAADGKIYLATEAFGAAVHRVNSANAPAPCLLRFDPATATFDAGFQVALSSLFDGATAGSLIRGAGGSVYLRVLDETLAPIDGNTNARVLASALAWRWARVTLGDAPAATKLDVAPSGGSVVAVPVGDRQLVSVFQGRASTTLLDITADGPGATAAATTAGLVFSAVQLR